MGAGRSGTTLLDIVLGNAAGVTSCGELNRYCQRTGLPPLADSSGEKAIFWREISEQLERNLGQLDFERISRLERRYSYHTGCLGSLLREISGPDGTEYLCYTQAFYNAIFSVSGTPFLVDSSKYPGRALGAAQALEGSKIRLVCVYLYRDPVDVVRSFAKKDVEQPSKNWIVANIYYASVNILCQLTAWRLKQRGIPVAAISYENLLADPRGTLTQISGSIGVDLKQAIDLLPDGELIVGPLFDGNRIRTRPYIRLENPAATGRAMSFRDLLTRLFNLFLYRS